MKIYNNFLLSILIIGWSIISHAQCNLIATSSGGNLGYTQVYILVDQSGNIVAQNSTGTFNSVANGVYQIHALNYDPLNPPAPLPSALIGQPLTDVGSSTLGCFNGDLLTDYVTQVCSSCAQTLEFCGTEPVVITSSGSAVGYTQLYVLVDTSSGLVIATNLTGNFTSDVVIGNSYTVHALNYSSSDAPIPLPTVGQDVLLTGGTYQGCANSDFLLDYVCININALPILPTASVTVQPDCTTPTGTITATLPVLAANEQYVLTGTAPVVASVNNTTGIFNGLAPGDYDVEVENTVTGCISPALSLTVNAIPSAPATATASVTVQPDCTTPTGTITATLPVLAANEEYVLTGTAPVVASVSNTTGIFTGLAPGDYDVEVENTVTGCVSTALSLTVNTVPGAPSTATASVTVQPDCTTPTGTITATLPVLGANEEYVLTGTAPVVASVNNTTGIFTGLAPGDYDVEVENTVTGCISPALSLTVNAIPSAPTTASASVTVQPDCATPTGTITATLPVLVGNEQYVLTGTAPVVASVSNTTGVFTGLAPGDYDVEVENTVTGCISIALSLTVNAIPSAPATATASVTVQPDCTTPTGTITATLPVLGANEEYVLTGTAPVVASVSNTTGVFTGLAPGDYDVEVENTVTGCVSTALSLTVNSAPGSPSTATASVTVQPDCATPTGTITATLPVLVANEQYVLTGTAPVVASVSNTTGVFTGLAPGDYDVEVENTVTGCISIALSLTVNAIPSAPATATASVTVQPDCTTPTGTITATLPVLAANEQYVLTGTAPVVASVSNTTGVFTGLAPGDYDVEVENTVTGCISIALSLTVNAIPSAPATATASVTVQPDCATPTGTITATLPVLAANEQYVLTGTAPVVASVNNTTGIFTGLAPGDYDVEVENTVTGCVSTALSLTVNIAPGSPATASASVTVQPDCATSTGTITATLPVLAANEQYVLTGIAPVVASVNNTTGIFTGLAPGDYDVEVENTVTGCISIALSLTVNAIPSAPATATASVTVQPDCTTPTGTITATLPVLGANEQYVLTGTAPVVASVNNTTGVFTGLAPGDYDVEVENTVTGCVSTALSLTVNTVPGAPATATASVTVQPDCTTPTGTITATAPALAANEEYVLTGTAPVVASVSNTTGIFTGLAPGDYNLEVENTVTGCISIALSLTVNAIPSGPIAPTATTTTQPDCTTQTGTITVSAPTGAAIEYSLDGVTYQSSPIFTGLDPGDYNITVQDNVTGCSSPITITTVNAVPNPIQVDAGPDVTIQQNESTTLTAVGEGSIVWETSEFTNSIIVSPSVTTNYCVNLVDSNGCTSVDCVNVIVLQDCGELYIPTAFSPDGDDNNDLYQIRINAQCVQSMQMQIFDRWGELIIEMNDINDTWDGTFRNEPLNNASFAYVLKIKLSNNPEEQLFKGNITLIK